ncbi:MAG: beta-lactamase family protein [Candidatus Magnetomorum sp.]|nr:beta-lactamase family protein [Candidatus Magnetomorum sp.]
MEAIDHAMTSAINDGIFPGASLHISYQYQTVYAKNFGVTRMVDGKNISDSTIFDLASLTKPLATTLAIMHMVQTGTLSLDQSLPEIFLEARQKDKALITVHHLLCHNSGLPDHRPYYEILKHELPNQRADLLLKNILNEPLVYPIGQKTIYSDLGFMLLDAAIQRVSGYRLDEYLQKNVYQPFGLKELFFIDLFKKHDFKTENFAATEVCPWRKKMLIAEVHDDNAYVVGGICGHAGLFGSIQNVYQLLDHLLGIYQDHPKKKELKKILTTQWVQKFFRIPEHAQRPLGFDVPTLPESSSGHFFSPNSVGHLGFTGTSFWMDLERSIIVILLTNRVHPHRNNIKIRKFRPIIHDIVMQSIL